MHVERPALGLGGEEFLDLRLRFMERLTKLEHDHLDLGVESSMQFGDLRVVLDHEHSTRVEFPSG